MKTKKVNKDDYCVNKKSGGYYEISLKELKNNRDHVVWGGDSASEDCYDKDLANDIYRRWDGDVYLINGEYRIDTGSILIY